MGHPATHNIGGEYGESLVFNGAGRLGDASRVLCRLKCRVSLYARRLRSPGNREMSPVFHAGGRRPLEAVDRSGGAVFCNPPYSRRKKDKPGQEDWIKKAAEEGSKPGAVVVMLLPARTDTAAFHEYIYHKAEIRFIRGRLRFRVGGKEGDAAPFPSMIVIFRGPEIAEEEMI